MANAWPCVNTLRDGSPCDGKRAAGIHSIHHADYHPYWKNKPAGLQPISEPMRAWRAASGYDKALRESKGEPCQIVSEKCTGFVQHLHEPLTSGRSGGKRAAVRDGGFIPACDACNDYCSNEGMEWAEMNGFLFRNTVEGREAAAEAKAARNLSRAASRRKDALDPLRDNGKSKSVRIEEIELNRTQTETAELLSRPSRRRSRLSTDDV